MRVKSKFKPAIEVAEVERRLTASRRELLVGGSDRAFRQLVHDTLAFSARILDIRTRFGQLIGLSGTAYTILISIGHLQGDVGVGVTQIAEHLHFSGAFVTIETNKLVAAGLVKKETNPEDRRRVLLTITPKASALLDRLTEAQAPTNDALFAPLSSGEFHMLRDLMSRLVDSGDKALRLISYRTADWETE